MCYIFKEKIYNTLLTHVLSFTLKYSLHCRALFEPLPNIQG